MDENHESSESLDDHAAYGEVSVEILRPLDIDIWPFFVECRLVDAAGRIWLFRDKWPIFTRADFDDQTEFPQPGVIRCQIIESHVSTDGRKLAVIDTERPDGVDSTTGDYRFEVFASQLDGNSEAKLEFGLVAIGCGVVWNVQIDETIGDPHRWFMQIEGAKDYLYFEIESSSIVDAWLRILETMIGDPKPSTELRLGALGDLPVTWIADDEFSDRGFVMVSAGGCGAIRITVAGPDLDDLRKAVRDLRDELNLD